MEKITRFGVSMNSKLLQKFDQYIHKKGYTNRSEAIRDIIRDHFVSQEWMAGETETVGTITLVYNHESGDISQRLLESQHNYCNYIISSIHVHLDEHNCLEVLVVKGIAKKIQEIADHLISNRGVKHGKLTVTTTGKEIL
ncbi:MAG: nickel-responsive transcriptional regulator NikR [bacterium]